MGDPNVRFGVGPSNNGGQFVGNQVADETLQMVSNGYFMDSELVQYMELDEFLDECDDLSFDQPNVQAGVSELNIEDFLDNKNDQAFEIQQNQDQAARSPKELLLREAQLNSGNNQEQNQNKRRRSSASTSNSSSSSNNSTSSLTTSIKTDFGGLVLNNSGITIDNRQFQGVRFQQIAGLQPGQIVSVQQAPSQIILPPVPQPQSKKQQQFLQNSQAQQSRIVQPGTSTPITKPRKPRQRKEKTQQAAPQPLIELNPVRSGPVTLNRSLSENTSVVVQRDPVQRSLSFVLAPPKNPPGSKKGAPLIVDRGPLTPQTPETPGSPGDIDLDDDQFLVPESPASAAGGGSKGKRKRKQSISDNLKDDKYWERRRKNNAAAKRSREERLAKEADVAKQATGLHAENSELKRSLAEALNANQQLKERLAKYEKIC